MNVARIGKGLDYRFASIVNELKESGADSESFDAKLESLSHEDRQQFLGKARDCLA